MNLEINSIHELKFVASDESQDFFILQGHNSIYKCKIWYDEAVELFLVEDIVSGEEEAYSLEQLKTMTSIMEAMKNGTLFMETTEIEAANIRTSLALFI